MWLCVLQRYNVMKQCLMFIATMSLMITYQLIHSYHFSHHINITCGRRGAKPPPLPTYLLALIKPGAHTNRRALTWRRSLGCHSINLKLRSGTHWKPMPAKTYQGTHFWMPPLEWYHSCARFRIPIAGYTFVHLAFELYHSCAIFSLYISQGTLSSTLHLNCTIVVQFSHYTDSKVHFRQPCTWMVP